MAPISSSFSSSKPHIVLFPFMSKGHTIPLLHLGRSLLDRGVALTVFTTGENHSFISDSLSSNDVSIVALPFPDNIPGVPKGVENTEKLPSMSLFVPFVNGTKLMQPFFEDELQKIDSHVTCIISDAFLTWTLESASKSGIPRLSFSGMSYYAHAVCSEAASSGLLSLHDSDDEPFALPTFPWIKITRNHFDEPFSTRYPSGPHWDFVLESIIATTNSYGMVVNTFYELEPLYADYVNKQSQPKTWSIGPFCLAKLEKRKLTHGHEPTWMHWLDQKLAQGSPVLYIAFGSQAKLSPKQLREIGLGLSRAEVSFLWVIKNSKDELGEGFEEEVRERGMIVNQWINQEEVLDHPIVQGFLSHCGWNSVLEGISAEVPILAWPMMAEQWINAKMVVEEIRVGLRVESASGSAKGFVSAGSLEETVRELMGGEKGRRARERVKEVAMAARKAMAEGGSSWNALDNLITQTQRQKEINASKLKL